jgi:hypothetical protein
MTKICINGRNYSIQVQFLETGARASVKVGGTPLFGRIIPSGSDTLATKSLLEQAQIFFPTATPIYSS